jgi:phenylalanyl-tRNA synthetase beta chain
MRVPVEWLRSLALTDAPTDEIAERLTSAGFEVEAVHRTGESWDGVVVGEVVAIAEHPNADRLNLPTVRYGDEELQVVCGAWNFKVGDKIPFALAGTVLWDPYAPEPTRRTLKPTRVRGVVSAGMLCSPKELGLSESHEGILILNPSLTVGAPLADVLGEEVIQFELKANRPDALSVLGIARETAALFNTPLQSPIRDNGPQVPALGLQVDVEVTDPQLCSRYAAAFVTDVQVTESPDWMRKRLELAGMRPINSIVDVTNYVMLELGQPLHAFDWAKISGGRIVVRPARSGERLVTLDGQDRELQPDTLVVADAERPVAVAGVMGGAHSEVSDATTTILLESATFNQFSVRRTAHRLTLRSEASRRFEKGLSPALTTVALRRCVELIEEIGAGHGDRLSADIYPAPDERLPVHLEFSRLEQLLGVSYGRDEVRQVLEAIGFAVGQEDGGLVVTPPYWRRDVTHPTDVIEEVARLLGYDRIPDTLPAGGMTDFVQGELDMLDDDIVDVMVGLGFSQCLLYALTSKARMGRLLPPDLPERNEEMPLGTPQAWQKVRAEAMNDAGREVADRLLPLHEKPVELRNWLSAEENVLRLTSLGTMLETLRANRRHLDRDLLLFECGPSFRRREGDQPAEPRLLTVATGQWLTATRWDDRTTVDLPYVKGLMDELLSRLGLQVGMSSGHEPPVRHVPLIHPTFAEGEAAAIVLDGRTVAAYGRINGSVAETFDFTESVWAALVDLQPVIEAASSPRFTAWSPYPPARRDLALVVSTDVAAEDLELTMRRTGKQLLRDVRLFDEYRGPPVDKDKRSLAFALTYGADDRTLTDADVDRVHERVVRTLSKRFGAELRT